MTKIKFQHFILLMLIMLLACQVCSAYSAETHAPDRTEYYAPYANQIIKVDGSGAERVWQLAKWQSLDHRWLGPEYSKKDFQGRYKVVWSKSKLYLLTEI